MPPKASKRVNTLATAPKHTQKSITSSKIDSLPEELFGAIFFYLAEGRDSLKICTFVHSSWRAVAQRLLFRSVVIDPVSFITTSPTNTRSSRRYNGNIHKCARLYDVLVSAPHLARCVRNLEVWEGREVDPRWDRLDPGEGYAWITSESTLPKVLDLLEQLQSFTLADNNFCPGIIWSRLPTTLRTSLMRVFGLPSLKSVTMQFNDHFPSRDFFSDCNKIRHLRLSSDTDEMASEDKPHRSTDEGSIPLSSLDLSLNDESFVAVAGWLLNPLCMLDVSQVQNLKIGLGNMSRKFVKHDEAFKLINRARTCLECLGFRPQTHYLETLENTKLDPVVLDNLPSLKKLVLEVPIQCSPGDTQYPLDWIREFISRIGERQSLQEITIILFIEPFHLSPLQMHYNLPELFAPAGANFSDIGEALLKAPLPLLDRIEFAFCGSSHNTPREIKLFGWYFIGHLIEVMPECIVKRLVKDVQLLSGVDDFLWKYPM